MSAEQGRKNIYGFDFSSQEWISFPFFFFFLDSMTGRQLTEKMEDDVGRKF